MDDELDGADVPRETSPDGVVAHLVGQLGLLVEFGRAQAGELAGVSRTLRKLPAQTPVQYATQGSVTIDAAGFGVIAFTPAGPDQGHFWYVRSLVVGGATWDTAAAGTAELYASAMDLRLMRDASPPLTDLLDQATALPLPAKYGRGELTLRNPERLFVRFVGATPGQEYIATIRLEDVQEAADRSEFSL